ncbi:hypothetical protein GCM10010191_20660 [Actinomadura vinacea]|uniref:Enoyl-CoA hydratase/isomerase family protein n=1 Tax=Actinomadura vinacea TaxID=115336 RepID=A0ABP5VWF0_9ACTN
MEARIRTLGQSDAIRAIVIRGQGGTFCAGSDMTAFRAVEECPVPVPAEVHSVTAGRKPSTRVTSSGGGNHRLKARRSRHVDRTGSPTCRCSWTTWCHRR